MDFVLLWNMVKGYSYYWWRAVKLLFTAVPKALWLFLSYYILLGWYSIFTPKEAEYIEDVPKLYSKIIEIEKFTLKYTMDIAILSIIKPKRWR